MKRAVSLVLALVLCFAFEVPAAAAEADPKTAADLLNGLGLFKGTGTDANGAPTYQLERPATRIEALVMLIRLIGREDEALSFTGPNPFDDVPEWADRYAAFAYSEKLANGRSATKYDANGIAQAKDYLTFVLRALGYDDKSENPPFTYNDANSFAMKLGLVDHIYGDGEFLRGDAAVSSAGALKQKKNGSDTTLIQSLVTDGAVTPNAARDAGFTDVTAMPASEEGKKVEIAVEKDGTITAEAVHAVLPQAKYIYEISASGATAEYMELSGMPLEEYLQNNLVYYVYPHRENYCFEFPYSLSYLNEDYSLWVCYTCIFDGDANIIATHIWDTDPYGNGKITFTRTYVDTRSVYDKMMERINASLVNKDSLEVIVDVNNPYGGWDDGGGMAYHYPVYVDGKELTPEYRLSYNFMNGVMSLEELLIWNQFVTFYNPMVISVYDENLNDYRMFDATLSAEGMDSCAYGRVWDARTDELIEEHFGLYTYERNIKEFDMVVIIHDLAGNVLGYTII